MLYKNIIFRYNKFRNIHCFILKIKKKSCYRKVYFIIDDKGGYEALLYNINKYIKHLKH